jgi:hypothetical protein
MVQVCLSRLAITETSRILSQFSMPSHICLITMFLLFDMVDSRCYAGLLLAPGKDEKLCIYRLLHIIFKGHISLPQSWKEPSSRQSKESGIVDNVSTISLAGASFRFPAFYRLVSASCSQLFGHIAHNHREF